MVTWAGVIWFFRAIALICGSSRKDGSSAEALRRQRKVNLAPGCSRAPQVQPRCSHQLLSGEPRQAKAVTTMPLERQKSISFSWFRCGWHSIWRNVEGLWLQCPAFGGFICFSGTWLVAGLCLRPGLLRTASIWSLLKLEMPMALTSPSSTSSSIA